MKNSQRCAAAISMKERAPALSSVYSFPESIAKRINVKSPREDDIASRTPQRRGEGGETFYAFLFCLLLCVYSDTAGEAYIACFR